MGGQANFLGSGGIPPVPPTRGNPTVYEKYIKCKKPCGQCFLWDFFHVVHLVWVQKLKQHVITIKVMTESQTYCGFQR